MTDPQKLLKWLSPERLEEAQDLGPKAILDLVKEYEAEQEEGRRHFSLVGYVGQNVWVNLPSEDRMATFEGIIYKIALDEDSGEILAYLTDSSDRQISFEILKYPPHIME